MRRLSPIVTALLLLALAAPAVASFTKIAGPSDQPGRGGVAAGDYDNDGDVDLYLTSFNEMPNTLLNNNGGASFENRAAVAGVALQGHESLGAAFADLDNDGWLDLIVGGANGSGYRVFKNQGDGTFQDVTETSGLYLQSEDQNDFSFAFGDPDQDGDLDMFITHWGTDISKADNFWLNDGTGRFIRADRHSGLTVFDDFDWTFSPVFSDIDNDGVQDLLVAADFGTSQVIRNNGSAEFEVVTNNAIDDENGMGQAAADFDNDGDIDWFVSSIMDEGGVFQGISLTGNRLYVNDGDGNFTDQSEAAGVRNGYWGWGVCAADFNNDGWLDIFHVNGALTFDSEGSYPEDPSVLFMNQGDGTFKEQAVALGIDDMDEGRGVSCFDQDGDGDVDIFVANNAQPWTIFRNDLSTENAWLNVSLRGNQHVSASGARITIEHDGSHQLREVTIGSNFQSQNPLVQHFGLASLENIETVRVRWPNGSETVLDDVASRQHLVIEAQADAFPPLFEVGGSTTAAWYDPERSGEGFLIEILPDDIAVLYWFTYNDDGQQDWYVSVGEVAGDRALFPELLSVSGGEFGPGFDSSAVVRTVVGSAAFTWTGCDSGIMDWNLNPGDANQRHGRQKLVRLTRLMSLECGPASLAPEIPEGQYSGSWYDPTHNGEGFIVEVLDNAQVLAYWFSFDTEGNRRWFFNVGEIRDGVMVFDDFLTTAGARFGKAFDSADLEVLPWGRLELEIDCQQGEARFDISEEGFPSGTLSLLRLTTIDGLSCPE